MVMERSKMKYIRGFIVYVERNYQDMKPYLKGLNLNLDSWRPFRYREVWRMQGYKLNMIDMDGK